MIDKKYVGHLIRSNRYLLMFITAAQLLMSIGNVTKAANEVFTAGNMFIAVVALYTVPLVIFSWVHDRKAIDTYGSLPLERKTLMLSGLLFCYMSVLIPTTVTMTANFLLACKDVTFVYALFEWLSLSVGMMAVITFNLAIYLLANSVFDGAVMVGAYTFFPLFTYAAVISVINTFIYGYSLGSTAILPYITPIGCLLSAFADFSYKTRLFFGISSGNEIVAYTAMLVAVLAVSCVILIRCFDKRQLERAGSASSGVFAYPLVIHCYAFICLLLAAVTVFSGRVSVHLEDFGEYFFIYILVFAAYVIAHFVYRRRFYIDMKMLVFLVISIGITVSFCYCAGATRGFGLTYKYELKSDNYRYVYEIYEPEKVGLDEYLSDKDIDAEYSYLIITGNSSEETKLKKYTIDFFESCRRRSIENHYSDKDTYGGYLNVYDGIRDYTYSMNFDRAYFYNGIDGVTIDDVITLSKDPAVYVRIDTDRHAYRMVDGELVTIPADEPLYYK